jgi:hypothetical protein
MSLATADGRARAKGMDRFAARRAHAQLARGTHGWIARTHRRLGMMIDVIGVKKLGGHTLEIEFSDSTIGVRDFADIFRKTGPMSEPLKDAVYFQRVFIEDGALTWPNGYDWDPIALHDEMNDAKQLKPAQAAE